MREARNEAAAEANAKDGSTRRGRASPLQGGGALAWRQRTRGADEVPERVRSFRTVCSIYSIATSYVDTMNYFLPIGNTLYR